MSDGSNGVTVTSSNSIVDLVREGLSNGVPLSECDRLLATSLHEKEGKMVEKRGTSNRTHTSPSHLNNFAQNQSQPNGEGLKARRAFKV